MKGERSDLRRPEGEGGRSRAVETGRRGRLEEREGERRLGGRPYGEPRGDAREEVERSGAGKGDFFSSLLVGPRVTNPIRTSPPG